MSFLPFRASFSNHTRANLASNIPHLSSAITPRKALSPDRFLCNAPRPMWCRAARHAAPFGLRSAATATPRPRVGQSRCFRGQRSEAVNRKTLKRSFFFFSSLFWLFIFSFYLWNFGPLKDGWLWDIEDFEKIGGDGFMLFPLFGMSLLLMIGLPKSWLGCSNVFGFVSGLHVVASCHCFGWGSFFPESWKWHQQKPWV